MFVGVGVGVNVLVGVGEIAQSPSFVQDILVDVQVHCGG